MPSLGINEYHGELWGREASSKASGGTGAKDPDGYGEDDAPSMAHKDETVFDRVSQWNDKMFCDWASSMVGLGGPGPGGSGSILVKIQERTVKVIWAAAMTLGRVY